MPLHFPKGAYMAWTDERVEKLKKLYIEGHSNATIARMIGGISRNAVIGKAARLGLGGNRRMPREAKELRQRLSTIHQRNAKRRESRKPTPVQSLFRDMPSEPLPPVDPSPAQVSFTDLESHHCRAITAEHMPFDANAKIYCGERKVLGTAYCEAHIRRYCRAPDDAARPSYIPFVKSSGPSARVQQANIAALDNVSEFMKETAT